MYTKMQFCQKKTLIRSTIIGIKREDLMIKTFVRINERGILKIGAIPPAGVAVKTLTHGGPSQTN